MAGPYDSLLADVEQQLDRTARFVPMAFHVHSPESFDWAQRAGADAAKNDRARLLNDPAGVREYLDSLAAEFSIVCVTDHMKSTYACRLAEEARPREDITVFPGVELNCVGQLGSSRIHLLAVFPPDANPTTIDRVCTVHTPGRFPAEAERQGQEELQVDSLKALAQAIHHEGGLFILAHIDEHQRGHRARFRVLREESLGFVRTAVGSDAPLEVQQQVSIEYTRYVNDLAPDAIEIMHPEDRHHYVVIDVGGQRQRIPCVIRSDHHSVEELSRAEAKTYVKVARHDFASVREALRFFETRVRYRDDLPTTPSPRLVGLRLRSPSRAGLFEDATLAFNPNLNCVIGSRGSGKSTIVEALRYALGLNGALIELPAAGNGQVNFAEIALRTQRANLKDTLIEVVYEIEGARYVLSSTYDAEAGVTTATFDLDGSERKIAAEALPVEFPVRLYSWSEIETLGREPDLQRRLLDRLITDLPKHIARRNQLLADLATNRNDIRGECQRLAALLRADNGLLRRYTQYKQDFERINIPEVAGLFADLDQARERLGLLESTKEALDDLRRQLESLVDSAATLLAGPAEGDVDADLLQWWESEIAPALALEPAREETTRLIEQALALTDARRSALDTLIETERQRVRETEAALRARTQAAPEEEVRRGQREERKTRFDRASERRQEYLEAFDRLKARLTERDGFARALELTQRQMATLRGDSRAELLDRLAAARTGMDIGIELSVGSDRRRPVAFMRDTDFLTFAVFGQYKAKEVAERCCGMATPVQIVRAILAKDQRELEHDKKLDEDGALTAEEGAKLVEHFYPFSHDDAADVDIIDETLISTLELEEQGIEDELRIVLNGRPVDRLSPGQRSSAMLPLVALSETAPLIIDQPEDNLDNRMVGETLTQILADLKERRQIIVTTHNPNIVVGGDAEQVVVVDATAAHVAVVERTGSVDDAAIIDAVVGIMEGGKEAFLMRERRYGLAS